MADGSVFTGFFPNWRERSEETQNKVKSSSEKKKLTKSSNNDVSEIKPLTKEVAYLKRAIADTKASTQETEEGKDEDGSTHNGVGTHFGGHYKN